VCREAAAEPTDWSWVRNAERHVDEGALQQARELSGVVRVERRRLPLEDLGQRAGARRERRASARHGFEHGQPESLVHRGEHEDLGRLIERTQRRVAHPSAQHDFVVRTAHLCGNA
jgi:hypothetical protein